MKSRVRRSPYKEKLQRRRNFTLLVKHGEVLARRGSRVEYSLAWSVPYTGTIINAVDMPADTYDTRQDKLTELSYIIVRDDPECLISVDDVKTPLSLYEVLKFRPSIARTELAYLWAYARRNTLPQDVVTSQSIHKFV